VSEEQGFTIKAANTFVCGLPHPSQGAHISWRLISRSMKR